jgi:hypothetical protein
MINLFKNKEEEQHGMDFVFIGGKDVKKDSKYKNNLKKRKYKKKH